MKKNIDVKERKSVFWKRLGRDGSESFVGLGQVYSDKTATTLKNSGLKFYPVHLVLLNFSAEVRRQLISSGASIVGYLPTSFEENEQSQESSKPKIRRNVILSTHHAVADMLGPLAHVAEQGFHYIDRKGVERTCHFAIASYCADIPERKDMTGILSGQLTAKTCFRCMIPSTEMHNCSAYDKRAWKTTKSILEESSRLDNGSSRVEKENIRVILKESSLSGIPPALCKFPFTSISDCTDVYNIHSFEPLHNLHLGVSKLIKLACVTRMQDENMKTPVFKCKNGQPR